MIHITQPYRMILPGQSPRRRAFLQIEKECGGDIEEMMQILAEDVTSFSLPLRTLDSAALLGDCIRETLFDTPEAANIAARLSQSVAPHSRKKDHWNMFHCLTTSSPHDSTYDKTSSIFKLNRHHTAETLNQLWEESDHSYTSLINFFYNPSFRLEWHTLEMGKIGRGGHDITKFVSGGPCLDLDLLRATVGDAATLRNLTYVLHPSRDLLMHSFHYYAETSFASKLPGLLSANIAALTDPTEFLTVSRYAFTDAGKNRFDSDRFNDAVWRSELNPSQLLQVLDPTMVGIADQYASVILPQIVEIGEGLPDLIQIATAAVSQLPSQRSS